MPSATVVGPGFKRVVPFEVGQLVRDVAGRAASEAGGTIPSEPIFIVDGNKVQPQEEITSPEDVHLTVALVTVNG